MRYGKIAALAEQSDLLDECIGDWKHYLNEALTQEYLK